VNPGNDNISTLGELAIVIKSTLVRDPDVQYLELDTS
jgi:hypothetical protein